MVLLSLSFDSLHGILRRLYDEMTELCQPMMTLATAIAALGALFYIAYRVWQSLSRAEPVDVFGMLRPFCLGICILFFDVIVLGSLNGILSPVVQGTGAMLHDQTFDVRKFQEEKDRLLAEMPLKVAVTGEFNPTDEELEKEIADMGWAYKKRWYYDLNGEWSASPFHNVPSNLHPSHQNISLCRHGTS